MEKEQVSRVKWSSEARQLLSTALLGDPIYVLDEWQYLVENEAAHLWSWQGGKGLIVTTAEPTPQGAELVIIAGAAKAQTLASLRAGLLSVIAQYPNVSTIRTHLKSRALARVYQGLGFAQAEIVMRRKNG